jgi:hypothetical protein
MCGMKKLFAIFGLFFCVANCSAADSNLQKISLKKNFQTEEFVLKNEVDFFEKGEKYFFKSSPVKFFEPNFCSRFQFLNSPKTAIIKNFPEFTAQDFSEISLRKIENFLRREIAPKFERKSSPVKIFADANGNILFDGAGTFGRKLEIHRSAQIVKKAFEKGISTVNLAFKKVKPKIEIDPNLSNKNFEQISLLAVGDSDFSGSPANRIFNIRTGAARFDGTVLRAGEIFSFNKILGKVDAAAGYRPELVIKGARTVPEFGGGLCQISTTVFRAATLAGLKIVERHPHAYAVNYYKPFGTDATIYVGGKNLRFLNDTGGDLILQMRVAGNKVFTHFYGKNDGRKIFTLGPQFWNFQAAPPPQRIFDESLAPGVEKVVSGIHPGLNAMWLQIVKKENGGGFLEKFFSPFEARGIVKIFGAES